MSGPLTVDVRHQVGAFSLQARFTVAAERGALFGPSGAGKSTLLRILAGLTMPASGTVRLGGRTLVDTAADLCVRPGERGIGLVTQTPALFPHLSVEANLRFGLFSLARGERERRTEELLRRFDLRALRDRVPARLSGGERQRVALARALASEPGLLLLDEPFSALDSAARSALWDTLESYLAERGIAMLLVSHDVGEVWSRAESVIRMDGGVATEQGSPACLLGWEREQALRQLGAL